MQLKKLSIRPIKILGVLVAIAYPIAVFVALQHNFSVRVLGLVLCGLILITMAWRKNIWMGLFGFLLTSQAAILNQEVFLKLYPVFMNLTVCALFAFSLRNVPLVQRFAEKMKYEINDKSKQYIRRVTIAWAIFMGINTLVSLSTVFMSDWVWTLYNGLISYCLIGIMMAGEYLVRIRVMHEDK